MSVLKTLIAFTAFIVSASGFSAFAQEYVGSSHCGQCHEPNYNIWAESGHHFSLVADSGTVPEYPFQYQTGTPNVPAPPMAFGLPLTWNDVSYVVGGYYREAVFAGQDGYLVTGSADDSTKWDVWDQNWLPYHPGDQLPLDCAKCHATGYDSSGHQGGLPGITGIWAEDGVGCEGCHGPDS